MIPVPELTGADVVWGSIKHLPPINDIPEEFNRHNNPYCDFVSHWFFSGLKPNDLARLTPRAGVDRGKALAAIKTILASFAPKHEHKEAGAAYLLSEWFELTAASAPR
jgi:hypothetical protein